MKKRENKKSEYVIPFSGLKEARHSFEFEIEKEFFGSISDSLIEGGKIHIDFVLEKRSTMLILEFEMDGYITAPCDRCTDPVDVDVEASEKLYVKFGEESMADSDEIIVLSEADYEIDIAPFIYEFIVLATPTRKVHEEGECNEEYLNKLEEYSFPEVDDSEDDDDDIDPRWAMLKNIK